MKSLLYTLVYTLLCVVFLTACKPQRPWRYEVRGFVNWKGQPHEAIWYTDKIDIDTENNSLVYWNSDGTKVTIYKPYILIDHKYDRMAPDTLLKD